MKYVKIDLRDNPVNWTYEDYLVFYRIVNTCELAVIDEKEAAREDSEHPTGLYLFKVQKEGRIVTAKKMIEIMLPGKVDYYIMTKPDDDFKRFEELKKIRDEIPS